MTLRFERFNIRSASVAGSTRLREGGLTTGDVEKEMLRLEGQGKTVMLVAVGSRVLGLLAQSFKAWRTALKAQSSAGTWRIT